MLLRAIHIAIAWTTRHTLTGHGKLQRQNVGQVKALDLPCTQQVHLAHCAARQRRAGGGLLIGRCIAKKKINRQLGWTGILAADHKGQRRQLDSVHGQR